MAAVNFTTIPLEPNTANYTLSHIWGGGGGGGFVPVIATLPILGLKFEIFPCVFMSNFMVFILQELWVNVLVAIVLGTVDLEPMLMQNFGGGGGGGKQGVLWECESSE